MNDCELQTVWPDPPQSVQNEVIQFWLSEQAMTEGAANDRATQLLVVARNTTGELAGVSTATPTWVERLKLKCFYFRTFVGKSNRTRGLRANDLVKLILRQSFDVLNARHDEGIDGDVCGIYLEVQNASVLRHRREAVWTDLGANIVFIGGTPSGGHARVWYFDGARF